jgi:hypothetical protein
MDKDLKRKENQELLIEKLDHDEKDIQEEEQNKWADTENQ